MERTKHSIFNISEIRKMYKEGEKLARERGIEYIGNDFSLGNRETAKKEKKETASLSQPGSQHKE